MVEQARAALRRPVVAGIVLLLAYVGLSLFNDTHGYLGTDTGGKTATLEAMDRAGNLDPDVGYWAKQWDPDAKFHPLFYTSRVGDRYLNITTLPIVVAAEPLWKLGGYRAALLLPMLGAVAAAFAARRIADRIVEGRGWLAFWITGLASAATVYALDFWEHTIGLALIAWGVIAVLEVYDQRSVARNSVLAGVAFGTAFTMRTEALVYAFVAVAIVCLLVLQRSRKPVEPIRIGVFALAGALVPVALNLALEYALVGESLRTSRAGGAAVRGGETLGFRLREGLTTTFSLSGSDNSAILLGALITLLLCVAIVKAKRHESIPDMPIVVAVAGMATALFVLDFASHRLHFIPGFMMVTPLAAVALVYAWTNERARLLAGLALIALPLVWLFQFSGGAVPQWGGRYVLTSAFLLAAVGVALAHRVHQAMVALLVALSVFVAAIGVGWLSERSRGIEDVRRDLRARTEPALISDIGFWLRELGPEALDHKWLSVAGPDDVDDAAAIVSEAGIDEMGVLSLNDGAHLMVPGWHETHADRYRWLGVDFRVVTYQRG